MNILFGSKVNAIKKIISHAYSNTESVSELAYDEIVKNLSQSLQNDSFFKNKQSASMFVSSLCQLSRKSLGMNPYFGQILNVAYMLDGYCTEVDTGEGKSLSIALASVCQVLRNPGCQIHVITANDYLAERDFYNHSRLFSSVGISVSYLKSDASIELKRRIYSTHVVYGSIKSLTLDYLSDKLVYNQDDVAQRANKRMAFIDEMDYICLDAAKTPIVISSQLNDQIETYITVYNAVSQFVEEDYEFEQETNYIGLTETGTRKIEQVFELDNLFNPENSRLLSLVNAALKSTYVLKKDHEYIVFENKIGVIDPFLGRVVENRKFIDGVQQFLEIKEGVSISIESVPVCSISIPYYLKTYIDFSGTSGTLLFDKIEIHDTYKKNIVKVESDHISNRTDNKDVVSLTKSDKIKSFLGFVKSVHDTGQPILIGAKSIEQSVEISKLLNGIEVQHQVINATNHSAEASILSNAGAFSAVTVATIMAGRGVDIVLEEKSKPLGLCVIGFEHFELRRQDSQLRGRCGRQGDIGMTQFFISIDEEIGEHELLKKIRSYVVKDDFDINKLNVLDRALESLQARKEVMAYMQRKQLLAFEEITNRQKMILFSLRDSILKSKDFSFLNEFFLEKVKEKDFFEFLKKIFPELNLKSDPLMALKTKIESFLLDATEAMPNAGENEIYNIVLAKIKTICLQTFDFYSQSFSYEMSLIEDGLEWRKKASKDVYREIYIETYDRFVFVLNSIKNDILSVVFRTKLHIKQN